YADAEYILVTNSALIGPIKAEFVTRMYSASAYAVCCGSFRAHFVRRIGESVGTMTETRGGFRRRIRTRFAVGYSKTSASSPRRFTASARAARFDWRACGFPPAAPEAGCSRQ